MFFWLVYFIRFSKFSWPVQQILYRFKGFSDSSEHFLAGSKHSLAGSEHIPANSLEQPLGLLLKGSTRVSYKLQLLVSSNVVVGIDDK
jgi:hypothetical protein